MITAKRAAARHPESLLDGHVVLGVPKIRGLLVSVRITRIAIF